MMKATNVTIRLSKRREGAARRQDGENSRRWKKYQYIMKKLEKYLINIWIYNKKQSKLKSLEKYKHVFWRLLSSGYSLDGKVICSYCATCSAQHISEDFFNIAIWINLCTCGASIPPSLAKREQRPERIQLVKLLHLSLH